MRQAQTHVWKVLATQNSLPGRPGRSQRGAKSRYSVNLEMAKAIYQMYGVLVQVGSGAYNKS